MTRQALQTVAPATLAEVSASWVDLSPTERRVRATKAAAEYDVAELGGLLRAYTFVHGTKGARVSPSTLEVYTAGAAQAVAWLRAEGVSLLRLPPDQAARWVRFLESKLAPATVRSRLAGVRALYRALRWAGAIATDPWADIRVGRDSSPSWARRLPYTAQEVTGLLEVATDQERVLILLGAHAGLRISEAVAVRWADLSGGVLRVTGKGGRQDIVPISSTLRAALDTLRATLGNVAEGATVLGLSVTAARRRLQRLCRWLGISAQGTTQAPGRGYHGLRHSCGTRLVAEGAPTVVAARVMRHSSVATTERYTHVCVQGAAGQLVGAW